MSQIYNKKNEPPSLWCYTQWTKWLSNVSRNGSMRQTKEEKLGGLKGAETMGKRENKESLPDEVCTAEQPWVFPHHMSYIYDNKWHRVAFYNFHRKVSVT